METTGLADPGPICFTFNSNATIQDNYRIDSVVCLVDAKHVNIHLDEEKPDGDINEAEHQIAFADRILLNKTDLVSAEELDDVVDRIRSINSFATIVKTERSRAPLDQVLGLNTFSLDKLNEIDPTIMVLHTHFLHLASSPLCPSFPLPFPFPCASPYAYPCAYPCVFPDRTLRC